MKIDELRLTKIVGVLLLCMLMLPASLFAGDTKISTTASFEPTIGTVWGYDFNTNQTGLREIISLDFYWDLHPYTSFESDIEGINPLREPYGMIEVSGLHLTSEVEDEDGDLSELSSLNFAINYEDIYGQINFYPFYLLLASSNSGNHYDRVGNFSFRKSTSRVRANWAYMDYRLMWNGKVSSDQWTLGGSADRLKNVRSTSLLGLGFVTGETEMMLAVGSPSDWEGNTDNVYDFGFSIDTPLVLENLNLKASIQSSINEPPVPLEFGTRLGYRQRLDSTYTLLPYFAVDGRFSSRETYFDGLALEQTTGVVLEWPGPTGWGYDPLNEMDLNRYSGLSLSFSNFVANVLADELEITTSAAITLMEETSGGVIPGLGAAAVLEFYDILPSDDDDDDYELTTTYGLYLDYDLDMFLPFTRIKKTAYEGGGLVGDDVSMELGVEMKLIPNTTMTAKYETSAINDLGNANKNLFTFEVLLNL